MINYTKILEDIYQQISPLLGSGEVAGYIPELSKVSPHQFGISVCMNNDDEYTLGSADKCFSIQSISKVFSLALAYKILGEKLWSRLGREPSGNKFDSLMQLENENGIPRNPFINAGALVIADILQEYYDDPAQEVLKLVHTLSGNPNISINQEVKSSEVTHANRNYALAYYMKSHGNINSDVDKLIHSYSSFCAIEASCIDLARSFRLFSSNGLNPWNNERILTPSQSKRMNAILMTCGLYNSVGDFAYRVGIPAKSGVGGGIVGVIPGEMSVSVWSPALDSFGNSLVGVNALELFTSMSGRSIY